MTPTVGRIVHYRLSHQDIGRIWPTGEPQVPVGNHHQAGDIVPLLVVRVWPDEYDSGQAVCRDMPLGKSYDDLEWVEAKSPHGINGQAFLDGNDTLWITSAPQADANGCWDWPEIVGTAVESTTYQSAAS